MNKHRKERSVRGFLTKNGFYIALVVCVIIAAVASFSAVTSILGNLRSENDTAQQQPPKTTPVETAPVDPPVIEDTTEDEEMSSDPLVPVYTLPVEDGVVTNHFSDGELVKNETLDDWRTHNGIDIEAAEGAEIKAIYSGEVVHAGYNPLLGNIVELKLDTGYTVIYANLGSVDAVKSGDLISQNDIIGTLGNSAILENGQKPHLHLEIKNGDSYIDPLSLLDY